MLRDLSSIREEDGTFKQSLNPALEEISISLTVNGRNIMTAMTSPDALEEFIVGFLFTEQIIQTIDEIESIRKENYSFSILTTNPFRVMGQKKIILSGCGGSSSFLDTRRLPKITSTLVVAPDAVRSSMKEIMDPIHHHQTEGTYRVGLISQGGNLHLAEDISRYNALDKAIGIGLKQRIALTQSYIVSSGEISSEMIRKCLIAGIPLIASWSVITTLAIEIAEQMGLCLIGFVRGDSMDIYTHPEHVQGAPILS